MRGDKKCKTEFIRWGKKRTRTNEGNSRKKKRGRETKGREGKVRLVGIRKIDRDIKSETK